MIDLAITGATGRMGTRLITLAKQDPDFRLVAALERPDHPQLGKDVGEAIGIGHIGVALASDVIGSPNVMIDFTSPTATRLFLSRCRAQRIPLVIGTTGLQAADHALIDQTGKDIPVLQAPNMSLGVNLLFKVAAEVARTLGDDYDIEIVEGHHRFKKDAPSGTALGLADAILKATGKTRDALIHDRHGDDCVRNRGEIGMHALRIGDEVGRHTAYFAALGERLELTHVATNRDTFVHGALRAAKWLTHQGPGRYTVADMLGLR